MTRTCEYTGRQYEGTGVIVNTTEGQQIMSPAGFGQFVRECITLAERIPGDAAPAFGQPETVTPEVPPKGTQSDENPPPATPDSDQITPPLVPADPSKSEPSATDGTSPEPEGPTNV